MFLLSELLHRVEASMLSHFEFHKRMLLPGLVSWEPVGREARQEKFLSPFLMRLSIHTTLWSVCLLHGSG